MHLNSKRKFSLKMALLESIKPSLEHFLFLTLLILLTFFVFAFSVQPCVWPPNNIILIFLVPFIYIWVTFGFLDQPLYMLCFTLTTLLYWYVVFSLTKFIIKFMNSVIKMNPGGKL